MRRIKKWTFLALLPGMLLCGCDGNGKGASQAAAEIEFSPPDLEISVQGDAENLAVACEGDAIYAVWEEDGPIVFNRSLDGGLTWLAQPVQLNIGPGATDGEDPIICSSGPHVYVAWKEARVSAYNVFVNASHDGGLTWMPVPAQVSFPDFADSEDPTIACDGLNVYVAWADDRVAGTDEDIYFNRSLDGGATWLSAEIQVEDDTPGANDSERPNLECDGLLVYAVWEEFTNGVGGEDVYFRRSEDGGLTWGTEVRLDAGDTNHADVDDLTFDHDGEHLYVAWADDRSEPPDIFANASADGGVTWLPEEQRLNTNAPDASTSEEPRICCDGPRVYVVWEDDRNFVPLVEQNVFFNRSLDGGVTWLAQDVQIDGSAADADQPHIACEGLNLFVTWEDERNSPTGHVFLAASTDGGTTWESDILVSESVPGIDPDDMHACPADDRIAILWTADHIFVNASAR